jgi:hypothetical protein
MSPLDRARLLDYAQDSFCILKISLQLATEGQPQFYRVAAVQLRILFCDTTRRHGRLEDLSLVGRLFPSLLLPPISAWALPSQVDREKWLDWQSWLQQPTPAGISVREFIRQVCDQDGGAHVDLRLTSPFNGFPGTQTCILSIAATALLALAPFLSPEE